MLNGRIGCEGECDDADRTCRGIDRGERGRRRRAVCAAGRDPARAVDCGADNAERCAESWFDDDATSTSDADAGTAVGSSDHEPVGRRCAKSSAHRSEVSESPTTEILMLQREPGEPIAAAHDV